jgi:magnesium transporter
MAEPTEADAEPRKDDEYELDRELVDSVIDALDVGDRSAVRAHAEELHAADFADLLEQLGAEKRRRLVEALGPDLDPEALPELSEGVRDEVLDALDPEVLAEAVKTLDTDDIVYLVEGLEEDERARLLSGLDAEDRFVVQKALTYPEYSAGRLMQREVVTAPPFWTVGQMIDFLRAADDLPDPFYDIVVVDPALKPIGKIPLHKILGNRRQRTLESLMDDDFRTLRLDEPQEDVAYAFNQYHLVSCPVVDEEGRLAGVITIDDAMVALQEEAGEDIMRLGGVGDEEIEDRIGEIAKRRAPWLVVNLATAVLASVVIAQFEAILAQIVALAVLMPIVASMGGNAGTQSLTVAVRGLATRDLTPTNALRVVAREGAVGLINGLLFAVLIAGIGAAWYGDPLLGLVLAMAMIITMFAAALAGILVPIALDRLGADPALASGVFVTTVTDVVGFLAFLGLAGMILL